MAVYKGIIELFHCLNCLFWSTILNKAEAHWASIFSSNNFGVFDWINLLKKLIELTLISIEVQIFNINNFTKLLGLLVLLLEFFLLFGNVFFIDHSYWSILEV